MCASCRSSNSTKQNDYVLRAIHHAAFRLTFLSVGEVVAFGMYFSGNGGQADTPVSRPGQTAVLFIWLTLVFFPPCILRYLHITSHRHLNSLTPGPMVRKPSSYKSKADDKNLANAVNLADPRVRDRMTWRAWLYNVICTGEP